MPEVTCTICTVPYTNLDDIYSTTCGHVYHFSCMQQWRSRSSSCPQCREHNPGTHRIFLDFDETTSDQKINEMKLELDQTLKSRSELQLQLDEVENDFFEVQKILTECEDKRIELESAYQILSAQNDSREQEIEKIIADGNSKASEEAELHLVRICSLEDRVKEVLLDLEQKNEDCLKLCEENIKLEKTVARNEKMHDNARKQYEAVERGLKIQMEHLNQEISTGTEIIEAQKKVIEELTLSRKQSEIDVCETPKDCFATYNENKSYEMLMQKLKLERELEKSFDKILELEENLLRSQEISNLEIESLKADNERKDIEIKNRKEEHMKLINRLSSLGSKATESSLRKRNEALSAKLEETRFELEKATQSSAEKDLAIQKLKQSENVLLEKLDTFIKKEPKSKSFEKGEYSDLANNTPAHACEATGVVIRGILGSDIKTPLTDTVLLFTKIMDIPCQTSDIADVSKLDKFKMRNKIQTENTTLVVKFSNLNTKIEFLANKEKLKTKGIHVSEYVNNETNELFHYAKSLRSIGFQHIFCKNNNVFAKYNFKSSAVKVNSKQQVDNIITKSRERKNEKCEKSLEENKEENEYKPEGENDVKKGTKAEECDDQYYRK